MFQNFGEREVQNQNQVPLQDYNFQTPFTHNDFHNVTFPIQETSSDELILVNDDITQHTFFHNYPSNPHIHAVRTFGGKNYNQSYKVISLGQYPTKLKLVLRTDRIGSNRTRFGFNPIRIESKKFGFESESNRINLIRVRSGFDLIRFGFDPDLIRIRFRFDPIQIQI